MSEPRDEIAEVLAVTEIAEALASWCSKSGDDMSHFLCGELVHRQHREQAEVLMPWLAERDRRVAGAALREAAESLRTQPMTVAGSYRAADYCGEYAEWLDDRADRIERDE